MNNKKNQSVKYSNYEISFFLSLNMQDIFFVLTSLRFFLNKQVNLFQEI